VTVNKHRYKEILHCLHNSIHCKSFELWRRKNWLLLHDNAPAHRSLCLSMRSWQNSRSPFRHTLHTHLTSHHAISFSFPAWKESHMSIDFSQPRRFSQPQGKLYGTFLQIAFNTVSSSYTNISRLAQRPTVTILRRMRICVSVNLVIWCDKTTVYEIIDWISNISKVYPSFSDHAIGDAMESY
jgi:hypothetical protein